MAGNKGFADIVARAGASEGKARSSVGVLSSRDNALVRLASGQVVAREHELVDPARCRMWDGHNRDYASLSAARCADLIESFRAQGRQEVPAIVRRLPGDVGHDFEVVCGARRHWTVSWLRGNGFPDFKFLVEARELSDEEAFRLADLENRSRQDLSDYERAVDYARAVERYYDGNQQRMVERLEVTKSWLSRYLVLAKLPPEVLAAVGDRHALGIKHASLLAPVLRSPESRERVLSEAAVVAEEQERLGSEARIPVSIVVRRLVNAAPHKTVAPLRAGPMISVRQPGLIVQGRLAARGRLDLTVTTGGLWNREAVLKALDELLGALQPDEPPPTVKPTLRKRSVRPALTDR